MPCSLTLPALRGSKGEGQVLYLARARAQQGSPAPRGGQGGQGKGGSGQRGASGVQGGQKGQGRAGRAVNEERGVRSCGGCRLLASSAAPQPAARVLHAHHAGAIHLQDHIAWLQGQGAPLCASQARARQVHQGSVRAGAGAAGAGAGVIGERNELPQQLRACVLDAHKLVGLGRRRRRSLSRGRARCQALLHAQRQRVHHERLQPQLRATRPAHTWQAHSKHQAPRGSSASTPLHLRLAQAMAGASASALQHSQGVQRAVAEGHGVRVQVSALAGGMQQRALARADLSQQCKVEGGAGHGARGMCAARLVRAPPLSPVPRAARARAFDSNFCGHGRCCRCPRARASSLTTIARCA